MRLALVVTGGVDESGRDNVIPALLWFIERQARRHQVVVYVLRYHDRSGTYPLLGATVHDLGRPEGLRRQYIALRRALERDGPFDVIHAYWALPAGLTAAAAGRRLGIPTIVTLDSGELVAVPDIGYGLQLTWKHRLAVAMTLRLATCLTVCTPYMARLARRLGAATGIVPLGADATKFEVSRTPDGPPWRLLHVANLNPVKDQPTLLAALERVLENVPDVHLDIAGRDTLGGAIHRLVAERGLGSHVTFHGAVPTDMLGRLYQQAHLVVLSSRHEAAGVVALEAALSGVAIAGTSVGYLADWAPEAALAVEPGDPAALASAITTLLGDSDRRRRLAARARAWALEHDADWTAEQFTEIYKEIRDRELRIKN